MPKTVIAPCMGIGKIVASVTRRAAYHVKGQCPEDVELLSIPALLAGDEHERELIRDNPSIIIDGCALRCGAHIYKLFGVEPAAKVEVAQIMKEKKLGPGKTRKELEEAGKKLSTFTADRVLEALNDELLKEGFAPVDELAQEPPGTVTGCAHAFPGAVAATGAEDKEAAQLAGVCTSGPEGERTADGKHRAKTVTILPCQGIKRTGGRVTQRAAYHLVEDKFLGRTNLLCISALAAGVQEDVDMLEKYPTVAIDGCAKRCASIAAEHHGIPAAASVALHELNPQYPCETHCLEPDLTESEAQEALNLAQAASVEVEKLLSGPIDWQPGKINLHGLVHESSTINKQTGFGDPGKGFLVQLAKHRLSAAPAAAKPAVAARPAVPASLDEAPGAGNVVANLFKPKPKAGIAK